MRRLRRLYQRARRVGLRGRLLVSFAGITILLALPAIYAASQLTQLRQIAFELRGQHAAAFRALGGAQMELTEFERFARSYVAVSGRVLRNDARHALTRAAAHVDALEEAGYEAQAADARARLAAHRTWLEQVVGLMEAGSADAAVAALDLLDSELTETHRTLNALAETIDRETVEKVLEARDISQFAATATLLAAAVCVTLALLLGVWSARTITAPIQRLRTAMAAVAEGSFETPAGLPYGRGDEVGGLARSFGWMTRRLGTLERLRAEYTSVVTHDLRTPVNVIGGYAELLEEGVHAPLVPGQRDAVAAIREQTSILAGLADQLLEISRIEATGPLAVEPHETPVRAFFDSVERAFSVLAAGSEIGLVVDVAPTLPDRIVIDPDRFRVQVLGNLLTNAIKFTGPGGRVTLKVWQQTGELHMQVIDTGIGIPEKDLPHVFDKFYRVRGEERAQGTGLGLAIAREVVEAHGGTITATSAPGRGTTIHVVLPQGAWR